MVIDRAAPMWYNGISNRANSPLIQQPKVAEREDINMARIYDKNGAKMGLQAICGELVESMTVEQKKVLAEATDRYNFDNDQMKLAHGILDTYRHIESTTEQGQRVRKLMDNLMTKYQKSTPATGDDLAFYRNVISEIHK